MIVGTTNLALLDRLSVRSAATGPTPTLFGLIGSLAFVVAAFLLFLPLAVSYFRGDWMQGIYTTLRRPDNFTLYSGCDFRMAFSFYHKSNGLLMNHSKLTNILSSYINFVSASKINYYADVLPCDPAYFAEMENKPHSFNPEDCLILPDGLVYNPQFLSGVSSVLGFKFFPICPDPFICTYRSQVDSQINQERFVFLSNHFYIARFATKVMDSSGKLKEKYFQIYSTEWQSQSLSLPHTFVRLETTTVYLDSSIMPWFNNETVRFASWSGLSRAEINDSPQLLALTAASYLQMSDTQIVAVREYKKLDWFLGVLGGGIFLLFHFFWLLCHSIAVARQNVFLCDETTFVQESSLPVVTMQHLHSPVKSAFFLLLSKLLPNQWKCLRDQKKILYCSLKVVDIVDLIKKIKIAERNLRAHRHQLKYERKPVDQLSSHPFNQQQIKYGINQRTLESVRSEHNIPKIYGNNISMLAIYNQSEEEAINEQIQQIKQNEGKFSKYNVPKLESASKIKSIGKWVKRIILIFDVFGAKPNLNAAPKDSSGFGCVLTLFVLVLSILTFALTLGNINKIRTYWDYIYESPWTQNVTIETGTNFRMALCFPEQAFNDLLLLGSDRVVDIKFYQYFRNISGQSYTYYPAVQIGLEGSTNYFDQSSSSYSNVNLSFCFKPKDFINITISGDQKSTNQQYFGFSLRPFCSGTPSYCQSVLNDTVKKFYQLLNFQLISLYVPQTKYLHETGRIVMDPNKQPFTQAIGLNFSRSVIQNIFMDSLHIIDDYQKWTMSGFSRPRLVYLTSQGRQIQSHLVSVDSDYPFYDIRVKTSGRVNRVIFTSYKIDFLFAIIGGCFSFYYFFFNLIANAYSRYRLKVSLAQQLYGIRAQQISKWRSFLRWLGLCCVAEDKTIQLVERQINYLTLSKNIDNVYRLSAVDYDSNLQKDLSLIYLKEQVSIMHDFEPRPRLDDHQEDNQPEDGMESSLQKFKRSNKVENESSENLFQQDQGHKVQKLKQEIKLQTKQVRSIPLPEEKFCDSFINKFDLFRSEPQFTMDGKTQYQSICGGISCCLLLVFVVMLLYHFWTLYSDQWHLVSTDRIAEQNQNLTGMRFEVGTNISLGLSVFKTDDFSMADVGLEVENVGLSLVKYRAAYVGGRNRLSSQYISLQKCSPSSFDGFLQQYNDSQFYQHLDRAYCVPKGTILNLYGASLDKEREYFSIKIHNKDSTNTSLQDTQAFLASYVPMVHISSPTVDYRTNGTLRYNMANIVKTVNYQSGVSRAFNVSLIKNKISYDTAVYPNNERPSFTTYEISQDPNSFQYQLAYQNNSARFFEINFNGQRMYNDMVIKSVKVNQLFGVVGGCILLLFFGLGCLPKSFNHYKMIYAQGTKLYRLKDTNDRQLKPLSQWQLIKAWLRSHLAFLEGNFTQNKQVRQVALLQSRVIKDSNVFQIMKHLYMCENAIKRLNLSSVNLCRLYPKKLVQIKQQQTEENRSLKKEVKDRHKRLIQIIKSNNLTYWETNLLMMAKSKGIKCNQIFNSPQVDLYMKQDQQKLEEKKEVMLMQQADKHKEKDKEVAIEEQTEYRK